MTVTPALSADKIEDLYAQAEASDQQRLDDLYSFDLSNHMRFKVVLKLYDTTYTSKAAGREATLERLNLMHESNQMNLAEFVFAQPGIPVVAHVLGRTTEGAWEQIDSKYDLELHAGFACMDCGVNTSDINEYYTVQDAVWAEATGDPASRGMLCIADIEHRLGRQLVPADFPDAPVNDPDWGEMSPRLLARITGAPEPA